MHSIYGTYTTDDGAEGLSEMDVARDCRLAASMWKSEIYSASNSSWLAGWLSTTADDTAGERPTSETFVDGSRLAVYESSAVIQPPSRWFTPVST